MAIKNTPQRKLSEQLYAGLPDGLTVSHFGEELVIIRSWFTKTAIIMLVFALFWNGMLLAMASDGGWFVFLLPHGWAGVWLIYKGVTGLVNQTEIRVSPTHLTIRHGPIPSFGNKTVDPATITQLYVQEKEHRNKNSTSYTYDVYMQPRYSSDTPLLKGVEDPRQALYLEQVMEDFMGVQDKPVSGEFHLRKMLRDQIAQGERWQAFAEINHLTFRANPGLGELQLLGSYQGFNLSLKGFYKTQGRNLKPVMQLTLTPQPLNKTTSGQGSQPTFTSGDVQRILARRQSISQKAQIQARSGRLSYEQPAIITDHDRLRRVLDSLRDVADAYFKMLPLGGEVVAVLLPVAKDKTHPFSLIAEQALREIGSMTQSLGDNIDFLLCKRCFTRCSDHKITLGWGNTITYYGCRVCYQSYDFFFANPVIAVLDDQTDIEEDLAAKVLRVNWLIKRDLFDFEIIEILKATDKDIEQLAMRVGNDTDTLRQGRYKDMPCIIGPDCQLSENSLRILKRTFRVEDA